MIGYLTQNYPLIHAFAPRPARRTRQETLVRNRVFKMAPKISDYFPEGEILAVKGSLDRPISGLVMDSRRVVPTRLEKAGFEFRHPELKEALAAVLD